LEATCT